MSNSNFDKNELFKSETHWFQYSAFVITRFAIYFDWALFNFVSLHYFDLKIFKSWNCNGFNPSDYCMMSWKVDLYP